MLAKRIIPCLDVTGGRVVKGVNFVELRDAGDPRLAGVAISRVVVTPDLKQAKVYFTLPAGMASQPALAAMRRARDYFRSHLAKILNMRYTPDLLFFFDNRNEEVQRIDDLFRQIEKERNDEPS